MKQLLYLLLAVLMVGSWFMFSKKGSELNEMRAQIEQQENKGDPDGLVPEMETKLNSIENERTFSGILLTFVSAGVVGILFVLFVLPFFAQRVTHAVYDSAEMIERDIMHDARSRVAQGDYEGAIAEFKKAAAQDPLNRLPWVEIVKIYKDNLHDPGAAIQTIRHALESQEWEISDAAFFLFRLAELYDELEGDRVSAKAIMEQVVNEFPGTRHSANAKHKLHEWSVQEEEAARAAEEQEFIAAQASGNTQDEQPSADGDGIR